MRQILILFICIIISGCSAKKDVRYFQNISLSESIPNNKDFVPVFQPNDLLKIYVFTDNNVGVEPFNLSSRSYINTEDAGSSNTEELKYMVDPDGNIDFPVFGKIAVAGKSKEELKDILKELLKPYLKNPMVHIERLNFRISILGDVGSPGVYNVPNEKISILEAIALAGDLNISALRDNILIIRENDGQTVFQEINLLDKSLFSSQYYHLKQNDVVYVKPNYIKTRESSWESRFPLIASISTFVLSIVILFVR